MGYKRLSNHDQELRTASDILLLLCSPRALIDPCAYAWLQRAFLKCTRTNHFRNSFAFTWTRIRLSRRITIQNALFFAFQNVFQKPDLKQLFVLHGLKSGFQIRKRPNHVLKRLSERDSSPCKHTQCFAQSRPALPYIEHSFIYI